MLRSSQAVDQTRTKQAPPLAVIFYGKTQHL